MPMEEKRINYAEAMRRKLEEEEHFKYHVKKQGESLVFQIPVGAKNTSWFDMKLRVGCGGDAKIWCYLANHIGEKRKAMIETLNALNDEYRFLTLCLDEDGDVCGSYDFILYGEGEAAAQHAKGMVFLVANVMDQCMPDIMKVVWGRQDEEEEEEEIREDLFGTQEEDEGE